MARSRAQKYVRPTFELGRRCLLCGRPIADQSREPWCCGEPARDPYLIKTAAGEPPEPVTFHRTRVLPDGSRRWVGTKDRDQHLVVWDEHAS